MSSLKKPEKLTSEIKEVDDEKFSNTKAVPQGLIKDTKKNDSKDKNKKENNNDEELSAPKSII